MTFRVGSVAKMALTGLKSSLRDGPGVECFSAESRYEVKGQIVFGVRLIYDVDSFDHLVGHHVHRHFGANT